MTEQHSVSSSRVAITGIGLATPLGLSASENLTGIRDNASGIGRIEAFSVENHLCTAGARVPQFDVASLMRFPKNEKFMTKAVRCALLAAREAITSSGGLEGRDPVRIALHTGSGQTGIEFDEFFKALSLAWQGGRELDFKYLGGVASRLIDPYFSLRTLANGGAGLLSMEFGIKGPSNNFVQSDTASAHALASAWHDLLEGRCDAAIAGGYESLLTDSLYLSWEDAGLLSPSPPGEAYRPFDRRRDGVVLGEGAGFLFLERWEDAQQRQANILGEIIGIDCAMDMATRSVPTWNLETLLTALPASRSDFVVAHGLGTMDEDRREAAALASLVGTEAPVTAFKSRTGYLGAAGAVVELALGLLCAREGFVPPIARFCCADPDVSLNLVSKEPRRLSGQEPLGLFFSAALGGQVSVIAARAIRS